MKRPLAFLPALLLSFALGAVLVRPQPVRSISCEEGCDGKSGDEKLQCLAEVQEACESALQETRAQKETLQSTINYINSKINLTQSQIWQTETEIELLGEEIGALSGKIDVLNVSLEKLTKVLVNRVHETYVNGKTQPMYLFLTSDGMSDFFKKYKYLRVSQQHDREVMFELEKTRSNYDQQKSIKEDKQVEMESLQTKLVSQKSALDEQQNEKQYLLEVTKNDERTYQNLLSQARAEYQAIQAIIAGRGNETEVREVKAGERIASVIQGASCNSSAAHLHFIVKKGDSVQNPFSYLKSADNENCSGSSCGSGDGDSFNPSGSWDWPVSPTIKFTQGYGETWAVKHTWVGRIYRFHNGIDINGSSSTVTSVQDGTLYRGSYNVGCQLRYVKVEHPDDTSTYYLHINY